MIIVYHADYKDTPSVQLPEKLDPNLSWKQTYYYSVLINSSYVLLLEDKTGSTLKVSTNLN